MRADSQRKQVSLRDKCRYCENNQVSGCEVFRMI